MKVFEANARAAPDANAAVVQVLPEKTEVSVSEELTNGWRRVRLQDGKTAFIRDEDVRLASASAVEPLPPATASAAATTGPVIYVKNLDHLAELVSSDDVVHPKVLSIQSKTPARLRRDARRPRRGHDAAGSRSITSPAPRTDGRSAAIARPAPR